MRFHFHLLFAEQRMTVARSPVIYEHRILMINVYHLFLHISFQLFRFWPTMSSTFHSDPIDLLYIMIRSYIVCLKSAWVRLWPQYYSDISNTPSLNGNLALCYDCKCIFLSGWCTHNAIILGRFSQQCHKTIVVFVIIVVVFVVADVVCIC